MNSTSNQPTSPSQMLRVEPIWNPNLRVVPTTHRWRSVKIGNYLFALLGLVLILGTVQVSQAAGFWTTSGKVTAGGTAISATGANPDEIKGWMKIDEVLGAYGVTKAELYAKFAIPDSLPATVQLKEVEKEAPGFTIDNLRTWLRERPGAATTKTKE